MCYYAWSHSEKRETSDDLYTSCYELLICPNLAVLAIPRRQLESRQIQTAFRLRYCPLFGGFVAASRRRYLGVLPCGLI